jgi:uncharacterized protein YjeT (DUF2065 family)
VTTFLAGAVVVLAAFYLLGFGALAVVVPAQASGYLHGFAGSVRMHVLELAARVAVGVAFLGYASRMQFASAFYVSGLILVITTFALAVLPWRWHQHFARTAVPAVRPYLPAIGLVSMAAGAFVFWAVASPLVG